MGGVDTLSCVIIPYTCQRRGLKWYRKLGELFLEICVYNSFCIWQKLNPDKSINNSKFRKLLIEELIMYHSHGSRPHQTGPRNFGGNPLRLLKRHFISIYQNGGSEKKYPEVNYVRFYTMKKRKDTRYWLSSEAWVCVYQNVLKFIIPSQTIESLLGKRKILMTQLKAQRDLLTQKATNFQTCI